MRLKPEDIEIHRTRNTPKCATVVLMDMSGSMRYDGLYINVKRMALGSGRADPPRVSRRLSCSSSRCTRFAKPRRSGEIVDLMPKPVTVFDPVVRLRADMSREDISEITWCRRTSRTFSTACSWPGSFWPLQDTPNRQIILITDGLPTAHFEEHDLYLLYPPDRAPKQATMREGTACASARGSRSISSCCPVGRSPRKTCTLPIAWPNRPKARVFFTAGGDLDRYVVWDYVKHKRELIG